jgi:hypothetical protein
MTAMLIKTLTTPHEIAEAFDLFTELRSNLSDKEKFVSQVIDQQKEGYRVMAIKDSGELVSAIGYRLLTMLAWGKILFNNKSKEARQWIWQNSPRSCNTTCKGEFM